MTVELMQNLSLVAFVLMSVSFLVAVALFFLMDIPKVWGELSGKTQRRTIENIRRKNEGNNKKENSVCSSANKNLTAEMTRSGRSVPRKKPPNTVSHAEKNTTAQLSDRAEETKALGSEETTLLEESRGTASKPERTVDQKVSAPMADAFTIDIQLEYTAGGNGIE